MLLRYCGPPKTWAPTEAPSQAVVREYGLIHYGGVHVVGDIHRVSLATVRILKISKCFWSSKSKRRVPSGCSGCVTARSLGCDWKEERSFKKRCTFYMWLALRTLLVISQRVLIVEVKYQTQLLGR